MKVAVASSGSDLQAQADPRFGRCQYFVIVDTDDMSFSSVDNSAAMQGSGAGFAAVQLVANAGADAVVAGNFGPNAASALAAGGLATYQFAGGTVRQAIEALKAGQLEQISGASVPSHFGMGGSGKAQPAGVASCATGPAGVGDATGSQQLSEQVGALESQLQDLKQQLERLSGQSK
jgi:predicted Fe-Mo cluster-binding NifX family protein